MSHIIDIEIQLDQDQLVQALAEAVRVSRWNGTDVTVNLQVRHLRFRASTGWAGTVAAADPVDHDRSTWSFLGDQDPEQYDCVEDMPEFSVADMLEQTRGGK